jgi:hypothetical protein
VEFVLTRLQTESAMRYNTRRLSEIGAPPDGLFKDFWDLGPVRPGVGTADYAAIIERFQHHRGIEADGKHGPGTQREMDRVYQEVETPSVEGLETLDDAARDRIVNHTVAFEGGHKNSYAACNRDAEYEGWFDAPRGKSKPAERTGKRHRASRYHSSGGFHIGLSYGAWQAAQEPGSLGTLLAQMRKADPIAFDEIFIHTEELLRVTNARGRRVGKRSKRTQPVAGADLWSKVWVKRFKAAGKVPAFQTAQRLWASSQYLVPALATCREYGLRSEGDLAVVFDIAIQFGVGSMKKRVARALDAGGAWSSDRIAAVIKTLPHSHRRRRQKILAAAGHGTQYNLGAGDG